MAHDTNHQELKQQALASLTQSRAEIGAEVHRLRHQLSPTRVAHRVVDKYPKRVMMLAFVVGIIPALVIFRKKPQPLYPTRPVKIYNAPPPKPFLTTLLVGAVGILARTVAPTLIKSSVIPQLLNSLTKNQPRVAGPAKSPKSPTVHR